MFHSTKLNRTLRGVFCCLFIFGITSIIQADETPKPAPTKSPLPQVKDVDPKSPSKQADNKEAKAEPKTEQKKPVAFEVVVSPEDEAKIKTLVQKLGHPRFKVREEASTQLHAMGLLPMKALYIAQNDPNPEIASRSRILLPAILTKDLQNRIDGFVADKEWKKEHRLPFLDRYTKLVPKDEMSHKIFVDMLNSNRALFEVADFRSKELADAYAAKVSEMTSIVFGLPQTKPSTVSDYYVMFLMGMDPDCAKSIETNQYIGNLLYQQTFNPELNSKERGSIARKLMIEWVDKSDNFNVQIASINLITQHNMKEGIQIAHKLFNNKTAPEYARLQAIQVFVRMGQKKDIPSFEKMLEDEAILNNWNVNGKNKVTQVRDAALALIIHLAGQKPSDFGFENINNGQQIVNVHMLGFEDDTARKAARKKWEDWKVKNPKWRDADFKAVEPKKEEPKKGGPIKEEAKKGEPKKELEKTPIIRPKLKLPPKPVEKAIEVKDDKIKAEKQAPQEKPTVEPEKLDTKPRLVPEKKDGF